MHLAHDGRHQQPGRFGGLGDGDGKGREEEIAEAAPKALGKGDEFTRHKPFQQQAEEIGEQNADEKRRHRHEHLVHRGGSPGENALVVPGQGDAQRDAEKQHKQPRQHRKCRRDCQFALHDLPHGLHVAVRDAEVAGDEAGQPPEIPGGEIALQPQLVAQRGGPLRRVVRAQDFGDGVAGNDLKGQKGHG